MTFLRFAIDILKIEVNLFTRSFLDDIVVEVINGEIKISAPFGAIT